MMLLTYFLQGAMNSVIGSVRGMGYSITALIMNVIGTCFTRLLWVFVIFPLPEFNTFVGLSLMYPFSWGASTILIGAISVFAFIKLDKLEKKVKLAEDEESKVAISGS
jgi:Na+-driven multidrug efflux pump